MAKVYDKKGSEKSTIDLPKSFQTPSREDILAKVYESLKMVYSQPYGLKKGAGGQYSASGILRKKRHAWKGTYGKGISRIPRKIMSRSGASFNWIGATAPNTRGGRRAHGPKQEKNVFRKINKKELNIAFQCALAGTFDAKSIEKKYGEKIPSGFIFDEKILTLKTKDLISVLKKLFEVNSSRILKTKKIRPGIGKIRGRKYKSNAGVLFVISSNEKMKGTGIDIVKAGNLNIRDLSPNGVPGRLTCYTENAIKELKEKFA